MFKTLANAWKIADLRQKLLFTILIILLYRIGAAIPVPFVSAITIESGTTFEFLNTLSGGAFEQASLFALGVSPYITASIVIQLLTVAIPALERLSKEGEEGKKKITQITRYITIAISLVTALGYYFLLKYNGALGSFISVENEGWQKVLNWVLGIVIVACYCAGSSITMWLAERINDKGIGNGISVILFANIVSRALPLFTRFVNMFQTEIGKLGIPSTGLGQVVNPDGTIKPLPGTEIETNAFPFGSIIFTVFVLVGLLAMMWFIIFISDSERRIPVQYAKRVVGRKMYGGQNSNIPLKLNMAGVMPIIFANAIITIPAMISQFIPTTKVDEVTGDTIARQPWFQIVKVFSSGHWFYCLLTFVLILAFAYFYVAISFNPTEVAGNIQKNGGAIPGLRPGKATSTFIQKVLSKITFIGALALSVISVIPLLIHVVLTIIRNNFEVNIAFWAFSYLGELATIGTSIIIVVGVVLEIVREMEAQMTMRHYKGFLG